MKKNWGFKEVALKNLILWDNNPRTFDKNSPNPKQKDIISRYDIDKLIRIAKNIIKYQDSNLQPGELTAVKKGKKYIVYDGNRRISAYKILLDPNLVSEKKDKVKKLSVKLNFKDTKKLHFNIAPDIQSALSRINDLHNDNFHENWNPTAKTNFTLLNINGKIKELNQKKTHLKRASLYEKIKSFNFSTEVQEIISDPAKFKITSLERIVDSNVGKKYLYYHFDEKGGIVIDGDEERFNEILKKIIEDVALGVADSRKQHNNEQKKEYFNTLLKDLNLKENSSKNENAAKKNTLGKLSKEVELIPRRNSVRYTSEKAAEIVKYILIHFDFVAEQLKTRHDGRPTIIINDEYDVQDLLHAILSMFFEDVVSEEWNPSDGASPSRPDFLLMDNGSIIEVKTTLTRKSQESTLRKKLEEELNNDLIKYSRRSDCKNIYLFIYDPEHKIKKHTTFERGMSTKKLDGISVFTHINRG